MAKNDNGAWSTLAAPLWVAALSAAFAATQLFIMAVSSSLEAVNRWPSVSVEYAQSATELTFYLNNAGPGPALIRSVTWKVNGREYRRWDDVLGHLSSGRADIEAHERISERVLAPNARVNFLILSRNERTEPVWKLWRAKNERSDFSVCYCSSMDESWVGRTASWVAGMPTCWIADRGSLRAHEAPGNTCPEPSLLE